MKTLRERICEELESGNYYVKKDEDYYVYELEADYSESISMNECWKICQSEHPTEMFDEWMFNGYAYSIHIIINSIEEQVIEALYDDGLLFDSEKEEAIDIMDELIIVELPDDHFLKQEVCVDIYLDTGDGNYDFVLNDISPAYNGKEFDKEIPEEASLRWLAETQGYTEKEMRDAFQTYNDNGVPEQGFLPSVYQELENTLTPMNAVTILAKMTFDELLQLNEAIKKSQNLNSETIHISKEAEVGLFDTWNGGGSLLEIKLEKDIDLPIKYIWRAQPDATEGFCYSIEDGYGVSRQIWRNVVTGISELN